MSSGNFKGFATLQSAGDLLQKIRHDHERLRSAPEDVYAAFDFFVSAYHMLDWLHPNEAAARKAEEEGNVLLQVCSHIANGAKHFQATANTILPSQTCTRKRAHFSATPFNQTPSRPAVSLLSSMERPH